MGQPARGKQNVVPAAPLASIAIHLLKEADLLAWRADLPETLKETAKQRLINDVKAALNRAWRDGKVRSDDAWRRLQPFEEADAARDSQAEQAGHRIIRNGVAEIAL